MSTLKIIIIKNKKKKVLCVMIAHYNSCSTRIATYTCNTKKKKKNNSWVNSHLSFSLILVCYLPFITYHINNREIFCRNFF